MSKLNLLNEEELAMLFGSVECLLPLHQGVYLGFFSMFGFGFLSIDYGFVTHFVFSVMLS